MSRSILAGLLAAISFAALVGSPAPAEAESAVVRQVVVASRPTWHAGYINVAEVSQRVIVRAEGDWYYAARSGCSEAGVPWSLELRAVAAELVAPECAPFSLVAQVEAPGEEPLRRCVVDQELLTLAPDASVSFQMNELRGQSADNAGVLRLELLVLDLAAQL